MNNDADSWIERASIEELKGESSVEKVIKKARHAAGAAGGGGGNSSSGSAAEGGGGGEGEECVVPGTSSRVVYVATSDNALSSVVRCNGAYAVSAGSLIEELTRRG